VRVRVRARSGCPEGFWPRSYCLEVVGFSSILLAARELWGLLARPKRVAATCLVDDLIIVGRRPVNNNTM